MTVWRLNKTVLQPASFIYYYYIYDDVSIRAFSGQQSGPDKYLHASSFFSEDEIPGQTF